MKMKNGIGHIYICDGVENISDCAFAYGTSLQGVSISRSVKSIGNHTFDRCTKISDIKMPKVTDIGYYAFIGCTNLKNVDMPNVTHVGERAFVDCREIIELRMPNIELIEYEAFNGCINLISAEMPKVTKLDGAAFINCSKLSSVIMPNVKNIGNSAFEMCENLDNIEIPENIDYLGQWIFSGCINLTTVTINSSDVAKNLTNQQVYGELIYHATTIYIKSGLTVGEYVTNKFTEATSNKAGYMMYVKK